MWGRNKCVLKKIDARMKVESERTLKRKCEVPDSVRDPDFGV